MAFFLSLLGGLLWGFLGFLLLPIIGLIGALFNPALSPKIIMRLYRSQAISIQQAPVLIELITVLSQRAGLKSPPTIHYINSQTLNAFAVGSRKQSAIAVTDGLLRQLSLREIAAVLGHEISHIRNNDLWVMGLADTFSRISSAFSFIGLFLLFINLPLLLFTNVMISWPAIALLIFAPHLTALAQLALSRVREYDADLNAAKLTNDPVGLAHALAKIEHIQGGWLEKILMPGRRIPTPSLLRTHPKTEDRIQRLTALKPSVDDKVLEELRRAEFDAHNIFGVPTRRRPRWHINGLWH